MTPGQKTAAAKNLDGAHSLARIADALASGESRQAELHAKLLPMFESMKPVFERAMKAESERSRGDLPAYVVWPLDEEGNTWAAESPDGMHQVTAEGPEEAIAAVRKAEAASSSLVTGT